MLTVRNIYKVCFERGAVESQKPALNPDAKTQAQGSRVFESKDGSLYLKRTAPKSTLISMTMPPKNLLAPMLSGSDGC